MSKKILISNLGQRDVYIDNMPIGGKAVNGIETYLTNINKGLKREEQKSFREITGKLLEEYSKSGNRLSFPIIEPFLKEFNNFRKVFLIVSNQADEKYKGTDTINSGKLLQKLIKDKYKIKVEIKEINGNPSDINELYSFYSELFCFIYKSEKCRKIISLSGGTSQMNLCVCLNAITIFKNFELWRVEEQTGNLCNIRYQDNIKKEFVKKSCLDLLENYDYAGIIRLLKKNNIESKKLIELLEYGKNRLYFNFEEANKHLDELIKLLNDSLKKKELEKFKIKFERYSAGFLIELHNNMLVKWKREEYVDFLGRLFRFEEGIYHYLLNKIFSEKFNVYLDFSNKKQNEKILKFLASNREFNNLTNVTVKGVKLGLNPLNRTSFFFILNTFRDYKKYTRIMDKVNKYKYDKKKKENKDSKYIKTSNCLGDYRNKSIIAHGFTAISKELIEEIYPGDLINDLNLLKRFLQKEVEICKTTNFVELNDQLKNIILNPNFS